MHQRADTKRHGMSGPQRSWWRETILWGGVLGAFIVGAVALVLALRPT